MNKVEEKINIPKDKHLGIIIDPRSGSHAFRDYISSALSIPNLSEFLNPIVYQPCFFIDKNKKTIHRLPNDKNGEQRFKIFNESVIKQWADERLDELSNITDIDQYGVFSILIKDVLSYYPEIVEKIKQRPDIYFIRLKRADVLYAIISIELSRYTNIWHNKNQNHTFSRENIKDKIEIPLDTIIDHLTSLIDAEKIIEKIFKGIPVIYYEQWQNNIRNINKILNLPNKIVSVNFHKFTGNYKNLISNIDEIEKYYEQFVNEHPQHFPQYFGKLPDIKIPDFQGRQPKNKKEYILDELC